MTELVCKHCGRTIQIPEGLETFSCVYCGEKMTHAEFLTPVGTSDEADREFVLQNLISTIRSHPSYGLKNFTKKNYEASFRAYQQELTEVYQAMERYIAANPADTDALLEEFSDRFLSDWEAMHTGRKAKGDAISDKMTLALYEVPAILDLGLNCGRDYVETMHRKFVAKYPNNVFLPGTYEDISAGFRKRKLCFITTAICEFEGKPDDCTELEAFRAFRDGWLSLNGGQALISEYYEIAPAIVSAIDFCDDREARYAALRRDYLTPCYEALLHGENERCCDRYVAMVQSLKQTYKLS